jgi:hypothetical protein
MTTTPCPSHLKKLAGDVLNATATAIVDAMANHEGHHGHHNMAPAASSGHSHHMMGDDDMMIVRIGRNHTHTHYGVYFYFISLQLNQDVLSRWLQRNSFV